MHFALPRLSLILLAVAVLIASDPANAAQRGHARHAPASKHSALHDKSVVAVRIWKDGRECPGGTARLRPLQDGKLDSSRYVDLRRANNLDGPENIGRTLGNMVTLNISALWDDMKMKPLRDSLSVIPPGAYVLTWISCGQGRGREWIGVDRPIFLFQETGNMSPVKGANYIEIGPGEVVDAGVLEIRSDEVGFFERQTGRVIAQSAPPHERDALLGVASKVRFTTFAEKFGMP
ncbi:hypothetical protein [Microvirga puerhi]|uniref:Uncharacterized protein n=1 Tax=Microvirga puerhi TaxID=2876078 RepID=A0ABS7VKK5_9HYPH|nr:hypothetical protein [Microvirga puerhi]MBZ6076070.1 hypothetical protein [Microvirga puerhi]